MELSAKKAGYTKAQFMQSSQYTGVEKDILRIRLDETKRYTHEQAKKAIADFKRKVARK